MRTPVTLVFAAGLVALSLSWSVNKAAAASDTSTQAQSSGATEKGFLIPYADPSRGRKLFGGKGCVVCHQINGVGGDDAPSLVSKEILASEDPFDFVARMWNAAGPMIAMQKDEMGGQIQLTGPQLADIIAFIHSPEERKKFSKNDISAKIKKILSKDE